MFKGRVVGEALGGELVDMGGDAIGLNVALRRSAASMVSVRWTSHACAREVRSGSYDDARENV